MKKPLLSIITVNLNNKDGLIETIGSIENQTVSDFEYIVIDGGSVDSSQHIIQQSNCVDKWLSEKDSGIYDAMNKGIQMASGDYLLFLNSGDKLYEKTTIKKALPFLNNFDIVYGDLFFSDKKNPYIYNYPEKLSFSFLFKASLAHPSTFIKRELFECFGLYDTTFKVIADWVFFIKVITKQNVSTKHIDQVISIFDMEGISSKPENLPQIMQARASFLKEEFALFYDDYIEHRNVIDTLERIQSSKCFKFFKNIGLKKFQ